MLRASYYDCHLQCFCGITCLKTHLEKSCSCSDCAEKQEELLSKGDSAMALLPQQRAVLQRRMLPHTSRVLPSVGQGRGTMLYCEAEGRYLELLNPTEAF